MFRNSLFPNFLLHSISRSSTRRILPKSAWKALTKLPFYPFSACSTVKQKHYIMELRFPSRHLKYWPVRKGSKLNADHAPHS
jgi:hypothetical protein